MQLTIDFGLLVLISMVQHIIYPAFRSIRESSFTDWHKRYTKQIGTLVMPLMLSQLGISSYAVLASPSFLSISHIVLVLGVWLHTFWVAVPIHQRLHKAKNAELIDQLVRVNWYRTLMWFGVFVLDIIWWLL